MTGLAQRCALTHVPYSLYRRRLSKLTPSRVNGKVTTTIVNMTKSLNYDHGFSLSSCQQDYDQVIASLCQAVNASTPRLTIADCTSHTIQPTAGELR